MKEIIDNIFKEADLLYKKIYDIVDSQKDKFLYTSDTSECDAIYGIVYYDVTTEVKIHALSIRDNELCAYIDNDDYWYVGKTLSKEYIIENDNNWEYLSKWGFFMYLATIVNIAESINEYVEK